MENELQGLRPLPQYREGREYIFPSDSSLEWTCRKHRRELVEAGALLLIGGRRMIDPPVFDAVILNAARRAAQAAMADEADA
jgi:hypothetical protein